MNRKYFLVTLKKEGVTAATLLSVLVLVMACIAESVKEGFLVKKGHVRHNWRTRWFVLLKKELMYFRSKEERLPAGVIPLNGANLICPPLEVSKKPWLLNLTTHDNKHYMIQAANQTERGSWKAAIEDSIRKLDPTKPRELSPTRTLTRTEGFTNTNDTYRDIVQAMQDRSAGIKLREFKLKGQNNNTKYYFTGSDAIDWLISWAFADDRSHASSLASEILQYGFFNPVHMDAKENVYKKVRDSILTREMVDSQDACYDFVVFAPAESMDVFSTVTEEGEGSGSDSDSEDDVLATRVGNAGTAFGNEDGKVLKQGFLLKKTKRGHTWKVRKFVLKEKETNLLYYKGSKGHRILGGVPLKDLTVVENNTNSQTCQQDKGLPTCLFSPTTTLPITPVTRKVKFRLVLLTSGGARYELEAVDSKERDSWASCIRNASEQC